MMRITENAEMRFTDLYVESSVTEQSMFFAICGTNIIVPGAKEITKNGRLLKFSELFKKADANTKSKVLKIATSQVAGYLYSGLVLGVGIAKLNIFITKQLQAKKNVQDEMKKEVSFVPSNQAKPLPLITIKHDGIFKEFN